MVVVGIPQISMERLLVSPPVLWHPETGKCLLDMEGKGGKPLLDYGLIRHEMWYVYVTRLNKIHNT